MVGRRARIFEPISVLETEIIVVDVVSNITTVTIVIRATDAITTPAPTSAATLPVVYSGPEDQSLGKTFGFGQVVTLQLV